MKHIFPSFHFVCLLLLPTIAAGQGFTPITPVASRSKPAEEKDGQALVAAAAEQLIVESAVSADLRFKIDAAGQQLVGTGKYLQLGDGPEKLLRLELKMQIGQRPATLLEICGSDSYWVRRDLPPAPATVGRVNLRSLRQTMARSRQIGPRDSLPLSGWIMLGGLPRLLASLQQSFDFHPATADELEFTGADGRSVQRLPIWVVEGRWKPDRLAELLGVEQDKIDLSALPEQLPDRVRLVLGRTEDVLPLFPYRITYLRPADGKRQGRGADAGKAGAGDAGSRELMTLELFNVHRKDDIDPREFDYNPGDQDVQDLTTAYVKRLSGETKVR